MVLFLYDIQDESKRTDLLRPFPFVKTIDPCIYAKEYLDAPLHVPIVVYRAVGKYNIDDFKKWLKERSGKDFFTVFVGAPNKKEQTSITIKEAYKLKKNLSKDIVLGGIVIPERHTKKHDEHLRVLSKVINGCDFFVSQCIYDLMGAKNFLDDYKKCMERENKPLVPIIFTITPCGSLKTLEFMEWLGIKIPEHLKNRLKNSENILRDSLALSRDIFEILFFYGKGKGIPVGCNVESLSIRKEEIDASLELLHDVQNIMKREK